MGDDERSAEALFSSADAHLTHDGAQCFICTLSIDEAQPLFYSWAAREGWNPAAIDPRLWATIDHRAFHVLYRQIPSTTTDTVVTTHTTTTTTSHQPASASVEPICILGTFIVDAEHAFLGPFITASAYQRRGFGSLLFDWGVQRLDPTRRCIGLDSTLEQQPSYQRRGFKHTADEEWRYAGIVAPSSGEESIEGDVEAEVVEVVAAHNGRVQFERMYELYEQCSESSLFSPTFCHTLFTSPGSVALAALSPASCSSTAPQVVSGLVVARRAGRGYRVAPLFARSPRIAVMLLQRLQMELGRGAEDECGIHIDVPSSNKEAVELIKQLSLKKVFASVRLYTRPPRSVLNKYYVYGSEPCP